MPLLSPDWGRGGRSAALQARIAVLVPAVGATSRPGLPSSGRGRSARRRLGASTSGLVLDQEPQVPQIERYQRRPIIGRWANPGRPGAWAEIAKFCEGDVARAILAFVGGAGRPSRGLGRRSGRIFAGANPGRCSRLGHRRMGRQCDSRPARCRLFDRDRGRVAATSDRRWRASPGRLHRRAARSYRPARRQQQPGQRREGEQGKLQVVAGESRHRSIRGEGAVNLG